MTRTVVCANGHKIVVPATFQAASARCPKCKLVVQIPSAQAVSSIAPATADEPRETTTCPQGHRLSVPRRIIGRTIRCPKCQTRFTVQSDPTRRPASAARDLSTLEFDSPERPAMKLPARKPAPVARRERPVRSGWPLKLWGAGAGVVGLVGLIVLLTSLFGGSTPGGPAARVPLHGPVSDRPAPTTDAPDTSALSAADVMAIQQVVRDLFAALQHDNRELFLASLTDTARQTMRDGMSAGWAPDSSALSSGATAEVGAVTGSGDEASVACTLKEAGIVYDTAIQLRRVDDKWLAYALRILLDPQAPEASLLVNLESPEDTAKQLMYQILLQEIPLPLAGQMPQQIEPLQFDGPAPIVLETIRTVESGFGSKEWEVRITNQSNKTVSEIATLAHYLDGNGRQIDTFPVSISGIQMNRRPAQLVAPRTMIIQQVGAPFMPPETTRVDFEVQSIRFADASEWQRSPGG